MNGSHPSLGNRVQRWLDRWGKAFVMEVECRDGNRFLVGLDPHWHGAPMMALPHDDGDDGPGGGGPGDDADDDGGDPARGTWADGLTAPDDLRDLVP